MNSIKQMVLAITAAALLLVPALAIADKPDPAGHGKGQSHGKAYGKYCQGESKKHVKGEKGTPYSRCVVAAAHAKKDADDGDDDGGPTGPTGTTGPQS